MMTRSFRVPAQVLYVCMYVCVCIMYVYDRDHLSCVGSYIIYIYTYIGRDYIYNIYIYIYIYIKRDKFVVSVRPHKF